MQLKLFNESKLTQAQACPCVCHYFQTAFGEELDSHDNLRLKCGCTSTGYFDRKCPGQPLTKEEGRRIIG